MICLFTWLLLDLVDFQTIQKGDTLSMIYRPEKMGLGLHLIFCPGDSSYILVLRRKKDDGCFD